MKAIEIHDLGKMYRIGEAQIQHDTFAAAALDAVQRPLKRFRSLLGGNAAGAAELNKDFWALRNVSLEIADGETVGIIGRNGSGKSTLLKILSRITEPTEGYARITGRVGSLLEVGTGFNLELTGRENVFLNGSILGMSIAEIDSKFEQILDFAGIGDFIDTPAKHYSSGMKVRLAFSVAAHLEPEILLIDEVLAVGDYAFQKKSLGKMKDVTKTGRTVLFVSHQLDMVREICERVVLLNAGGIEMIGNAEEVIDYYVKSFGEENSGKASFFCELEAERPFQLLSGRVLNSAGETCLHFDVFDPIIFEFEYEIREPVEGLTVNFTLKRAGEPLLMSFDTDATPERLNGRANGRYRSRVQIPSPLLKSGLYSLDVKMGYIRGRSHDLHKLDDILSFDVDLTSKPSAMLSYSEKRPGRLALELDWTEEMADLSGNL